MWARHSQVFDASEGEVRHVHSYGVDEPGLDNEVGLPNTRGAKEITFLSGDG